MKMIVSKLQSVGFFPQVSFSLKDDNCLCLFCEEEVMEFSMFCNLFESYQIHEAFGFV